MLTPQVEVSNLIKPLLDAFKKADEEWDNFFEIGLSDYLYSQTNKYYFTNTFIHRSEKVRFDDIYYPINASYKKLTSNFSELEKIFDEYKNITIVGSAGSGKTTLMKYIFLRAISDKTRIPILIELRNLNEYNGDFEKLITEKVLKSNIKPGDTTFKRTLKSGKFLFLLDGYDEIFSIKKQEINRQIELFVDSCPENRFLITTRPGSGIEGFPRFCDFKVCSLNDKDVVGFISKIVEEEERRDRISQLVVNPKNKNYLEFLRNPLLLSMFIMAFENHPEIPKRKSAFYRNVFDTLYSKHDGITKNSFPREKATKLQRDDFEDILSIFCYLTLIEGQYAFTEEYLTDILQKVEKATEYSFSVQDLVYDLHTSISILILDGFEYSFPHRSMQEYFTALFVSKLPTNKKIKAYTNLSNALQESSTDYSFNFWGLCFELDEVMFISSFLIPHLKKILKIFAQKSGKQLLNAYFKLINPVLLSTFLEGKQEKKKDGVRIYRHLNFESSVLDFCEIYAYDSVWKFPENNNGCANELYQIYLTRMEAISNNNKSINIQGDDEIIDVLLKYNFLKLIESIRDNISAKITKWDTAINRKKVNIDDLLSL